MYKYTFPECVVAKNTIKDRIEKIKSEIKEYEVSHDDLELFDILHAVESLMRLHLQGKEDRTLQFMRAVYEKNKARGYYD